MYNLFYNLFSGIEDINKRSRFTRTLAIISTVKYDGVRGLPQGSPCSPAIFNRILFSLDCELEKKSCERDFRYTRWIDDFTITSGDKKRIEDCIGAVGLVDSFVPISKRKTFFQDKPPIYLLGHRIIDIFSIEKNSKEDRLMNKTPPVDYFEWFGDNKVKKYESW